MIIAFGLSIEILHKHGQQESGKVWDKKSPAMCQAGMVSVIRLKGRDL